MSDRTFLAWNGCSMTNVVESCLKSWYANMPMHAVAVQTLLASAIKAASILEKIDPMDSIFKNIEYNHQTGGLRATLGGWIPRVSVP